MMSPSRPTTLPENVSAGSDVRVQADRSDEATTMAAVHRTKPFDPRAAVNEVVWTVMRHAARILYSLRVLLSRRQARPSATTAADAAPCSFAAGSGVAVARR